MKAITVKAIPATDHKPAVWQAKAEGTKPANYVNGLAPDEAACAYAGKNGWKGTLIGGTLPDGVTKVYVFVNPDDTHNI